MNPCPQCGAIPQATDKFCNICGTPVSPPAFGAQPGGFPPPAPATGGSFGAPPQNAYGAPPGQGALRCAMGHDIAPGASYCPHGHPIAMEQQMQGMPYGAPQDQYGYGQQQPGFGAPPMQQGGFGAPPPQFGAPQGYPDPNQGWGQPPPGFGAPPPQGGYGAPAPYGAPQGYGPQPGYPGAPPQGYGAPEPPPGVPAPPTNLPPNALRGFLLSYQSNTQGDFWPLHGGRKTVGRANSGENVDIPLADATISSRHAAFTIDGSTGSVIVEDTGSTNGTFVNEEHIGFNGKRELRDGDRIRFGGYTTTVKVVSRI